MKKKKILVLGYFGYRTNQLDGQTVKTRAIYELLKKHYNGEVVFADTQEFRHNPKAIWKFFKDILNCRELILLPCLNNLKYIFPIAFGLSKVIRFGIIHIGIGGWHVEYLSKWPIIRRMLKHIKVNLLETSLTAKELEEKFGFRNIKIFPNFRIYDELSAPEINNHQPLRLVFMARINLKKGLDTLSTLCDLFCKNRRSDLISLSIYGPVDSLKDKDYLVNEIVNRFSFVKYYGVLSPEQINKTLSDKDIFLFPTHYYTEGFPGSILDAYYAGIPVIATNWQHANQFIVDNKSGYIVDFNNPAPQMYKHIKFLLNNPDKLSDMKKHAFEEQKKYTEDSAWEILKNYIG